MKEDFKNFIKRSRDIKLSETEKGFLRSKISEFISFSPIRGKAPILREKTYISIFEVQHFMKAASLVLIIAVVVGGTGVSYAASNALPGEALYAVKVNINEGLEESLARTPQAKLALQSEHIQKRLDEVQTLRKENRLSPATQKIVIAKLDEHTESASKSIDELREAGDMSSVLEATSDLTPIFEANKNILQKEQDKNESRDEDNTELLIAKIDDSNKVFQDQENSIIASVENDSEEPNMAMTMSVMDPSANTKMTAEEAANKETSDNIKEISEQIADIVDERIDTAKDKISAIKASVAKEKALIKEEAEIMEPEEASMETKIDAETKEAEVTETISIRMADAPINSKAAITATKDVVVETKPVIEESVAETTISTPVVADVFDVDAKIKEAEVILDKAQVLFERNKFKEALMLAQDVNRIAGEIETYRRMKALDLAKNKQESSSLKASVSESTKAQ